MDIIKMVIIVLYAWINLKHVVMLQLVLNVKVIIDLLLHLNVFVKMDTLMMELIKLIVISVIHHVRPVKIHKINVYLVLMVIT